MVLSSHVYLLNANPGFGRQPTEIVQNPKQ
jgi:hypothetical protein